MAPKTTGGALELSSKLDINFFASLTVFATGPPYRSGAKARNPWEASRSQRLLKKSFNPHQACKTSTPPRWISGDDRYPVALPVSVLNSTIRPVFFKVKNQELFDSRRFYCFWNVRSGLKKIIRLTIFLK